MKLNQSNVIFDKDNHTYYIDGKQLNGITGILRKRLFQDEYVGVSQEVLNNAAKRGSEIHYACECLDNGLAVVTNYMAEVRAYKDLKEKNQLNHAATEYIVTDGQHFASAIDKVYEVDDSTVDLADIKTTSKLNKDYVSWQLSIYAYFFEMINPHVTVRNLYAIHIRDGKAKLTKVPSIPRDKVLDLLADEVFDAPIKKVENNLPSMPTKYLQMQEDIIEMMQYYAELDSKLKAIKEELLERMDEAEVTKWEGEYLTFTRNADSSRTTFDTKRFKKEHEDLYKQYTIITNSRGSVSIKIK